MDQRVRTGAEAYLPDARTLPAMRRAVKHFQMGASRQAPAPQEAVGATAAQALLGRAFRVTQQRGRVVTAPSGVRAVATVHPSSIVRRRTDDDRHLEMSRFVGDLQVAAALLNRRGPV